MMQELKYTASQIAEMRKLWDVPNNFIPVAAAGGAIAWVTKNSIIKSEGK